jgi:hypothetical protein
MSAREADELGFLFPLPEPADDARKLAWMERHKITVSELKTGFYARGLFRRNHEGRVLAFTAVTAAPALTRDEAIRDLVIAAGVPLWFEEEFVRERGGLEA